MAVRALRRAWMVCLVLALLATTGAAQAIASPGTVTTFSTLAALKYPQGLAMGADGNLWATNDGPTGRGHLTRIEPDGTMTAFRDVTLLHPGEIVAGADGNLWFATFNGSGDSAVGRLSPADGAVVLYPAPIDGRAEHLVATPTGVWFTDAASRVGRIQPDGTVTTWAVAGACCHPAGGLTLGPDGNLWSTVPAAGAVVRTAPDGTTSSFVVGGHPTAIVAGPDDRLWFTDDGGIGRITTAGDEEHFDHELVRGADEIVLGGDGNLWFTSSATSRIGRATPDGQIRMSWHPSAASATALTVATSGDVWYVAPTLDVVGRVRPDGVIRTFGGSGVSAPGVLSTGPGDQLWFGAGGTAIGSISAVGDITTHDAPADTSQPQDLLVGPDGNVWFTAPRAEADDPIGRLTPGGDVRTFGDGAVCRTARPCFHVWGGVDLTTGPDGRLWFLDTEGQIVRSTLDGELTVWAAPGYPMSSIAVGADHRLWIGGGVGGRTGGRIFRLDPATGHLRRFHGAGLGAETRDLVVGPDGRIWFIAGSDRIGRISTDGTIRTFRDPAVRDIEDLVVGADGALWFSSHRRITRLTTAGTMTGHTHPALGRALALVAGADGNLWFVTPAASRIGRLTPTGRFFLTRHPEVVVAEGNVETVAVQDGLWVTSTGTDRVVHVAFDGTVETTVIGPLAHGLAAGPGDEVWVGVRGGIAHVETAS